MRLTALVLVACVSLFAQATNVQLVGTTATQATFTYTAPSTAACTWEVSEHEDNTPDYTPLHADVDSSLFSGANSDGGGPVNRRKILGKRGRWFTTDAGAVTSRTLRAAMPYDWRLTCGSAVTGTFATRTVNWANLAEEPIPPLTAGGPTPMPTLPAGGRWSGAHPVTGVYWKYPIALYDDLENPVALACAAPNCDIDTNANWTDEANCEDNDDAFCSTSTADDPITIHDTAPYISTSYHPFMSTFYVRVKECSHSGAGQDIQARVSLNNGVDYSDWVIASCPSVAADVDIGAGGYANWWGLTPIAQNFVQGKGVIIDNSGDTGTSTTIEFENNAAGQDDCDSLIVGGDMAFTLDDLNDTPTTYTVSSKSCGSTPPNVVINTAVDIHRGDEGVPWGLRAGYWNNDALVMQVKMAAGGSGTITLDNVQFVPDMVEGVDQVNAGMFREAAYENSDGWNLISGGGGQAGAQNAFPLYAVKKNGRDLTINLFEAASHFGSELGGSGIVPMIGSAANNWSSGGAGADAWKTLYIAVSQQDGDFAIGKVVFDKADPEVATTSPLVRSSLVPYNPGADHADVLIYDGEDGVGLPALLDSFATANGLTTGDEDFSLYKYVSCALELVQGSSAGDIGVGYCRAGGQDTPAYMFWLDLANGLGCGGTGEGSGWVSSHTINTDCSSTDLVNGLGEGLVLAMVNLARVPGIRWNMQWHATEPDMTQGKAFADNRTVLSWQTAKATMWQPTHQVYLADGDTTTGGTQDLPEISVQTDDVEILVRSFLPTDVAPTGGLGGTFCDNAAGCETTITCTGTTCWGGDGGTESFRYHLGISYTVTVSGEDRTVTALNDDGSVTISSAFTSDPSGASYTYDPTFSGWTGGCPLSGGLNMAGGKGFDAPHFNKCIEVGDVGYIGATEDEIEFTGGADHFEVTAVADQGDGTWKLTINRKIAGTVDNSPGPYTAVATPGDITAAVLSFETEAYIRAGAGAGVICDIMTDPDCSEAAVIKGGGHNSFVSSVSDSSKDLRQGSNGAFIQGDLSTGTFDRVGSHVTDVNPTWAGAISCLGDGNSAQKHPGQPGLDPALGGKGLTAYDHFTMMGGCHPTTPDNTEYSLVAGRSHTYEVTFPATFYHKRLGNRAFVGRRQFLSKSGPSSVLADTDYGYYCFAAVTNECISGSTAGDFYFVSKWMNPARQYNVSTEASNVVDFAVNDPGFFPIISTSDSINEFYLRRHFDGTNQVQLGGKFMRALLPYIYPSRGQTVFGNVQPFFDDASWGMTLILDNPRGLNLAMFEFPPIAADQSNDPTTFVRVLIDIDQVTGADDAIVAFGYNQDGIDGNDDDLYCRPNTYLDKCYVVSPTVTDATPFQWGSESLASTISFSGGRATIEVPALMNRMLYVQVIQRNVSDEAISTSRIEVIPVN